MAQAAANEARTARLDERSRSPDSADSPLLDAEGLRAELRRARARHEELLAQLADVRAGLSRSQAVARRMSASQALSRERVGEAVASEVRAAAQELERLMAELEGKVAAAEARTAP
ncbi:MAG: hypothetical protein D6731_00105 [Planctomycetota bacterium]|nr:MAG: hypothetical protein D6731_00105 [Planctomycetota bacterium]